MKYKTNEELRQMSGAELDEYTAALTEAGLAEGPEWDRIYTFWEAN